MRVCVCEFIYNFNRALIFFIFRLCVFSHYSATASDSFNRSPVPQRLFSINTPDESVNVTFVSSPAQKKRDPAATAVTATAKSTSRIPFASAGAAIPNDTITKDETVETDERSSNASQAIKTNSKATRSSKSFFKRKDKSAKQQRGSGANTNKTNNHKNNESHGFISSFNQITSNNLPVISSATTTMLRNAVSGGGGGGGAGSITNKKGERNSAMDTFATEFIDDFTNDYSMEQILNKKHKAKDDFSKYSKHSQLPFLFIGRFH